MASAGGVKSAVTTRDAELTAPLLFVSPIRTGIVMVAGPIVVPSFTPLSVITSLCALATPLRLMVTFEPLTLTLNPSVSASVNFYGIHPNVKPDYTKLTGPVLGLFAEKDGFVTPQVAKDTDAAIKKAGKQSEINIYPGVDHGFFNDDRADVYNKAAAADAWKRTLGFFRQHVK